MKRKMLLYPIGWLLVFVSGLGIYFLHQQIGQNRSTWKNRHSDLYYLPSPKVLQTVSLGHRAFLADLIWIKALLYVGTHLSSDKGGIEWLSRYVNAIVDLDPKFRQPYSWGAALVVYNREKARRERVYEAIKILKKGKKNFPNDYYFPEALGMAYLVDIRLSDRSLEELKQDFRSFCKNQPLTLSQKIPLIKKVRGCLRATAGEFMFEAATKDNAPPHVMSRGAGFMGRTYGKKGHVAICSHLIDVLSLSNQDDVRDQVKEKMKVYCKADVRKVLFCKENKYSERWKKNYPYLSRVLFGLMDIHPRLLDGTPITFPLPVLPENLCEK